MVEREAFQEIDYRRMYGQMAKWVAEIDDARRIPEFVARAFHTATSGRPGPVVLALARGHAARPRRDRRPGPLPQGRKPPGPGRHGRPGHASGPRRNARSCCSAAAAGVPKPAAISRPSPKRGRCRSPSPSAVRTMSTTAMPTTLATSASGRTRPWPRRCRTATCCWWSAPAWAR